MASRESMNMGSRSSSIISELKSVISLLGQTTDNAFQRITSGISKTSSVGGQNAGASNMLVAPNPVFNAPPVSSLTQTGSGLVASGPSGPSSSLVARGATNLSIYASQTGAATLYQPERGSVGVSGYGGNLGGGSGGGSGGRNNFNTGSGGTSGAGGAGSGSYLGLSNIPLVGTAIGAGYAIYNTASNLTPSTSDILESQLLQQRASFYTGGGKSGIGNIQASQQSVAQAAMLSGDNPQMDVMRAQIAAQSYGLGSSVNSLLKSAANVSNLMPGIGVEGAIRATGSMQQASNVNMLRGIGIQLRDPITGQLKGPDEVIDQVWKKISRDYSQAYGGGKTPSLNEVQIALQPGNSLDSMLNMYFGNDPMLKQLVANGLIYKAQGGSLGAGAIKGGVTELGGTTSAMLSYSSTAAAGQGFLVGAQGESAAGFMGANTQITKYYENVGVATALSFAKSFGDTLLTAFGGNPASALLATGAANILPAIKGTLDFISTPSSAIVTALEGVFKAFNLSSLLGVLPGMASGGPVSANSPYIVGEVGPELFIPNSNGTIVSNDKLTSGATTYNFTINAPSGNTQDLVTEIKNVLVQIETNKKVSES